MKNVQSLQNWQFQSPSFQKLATIVPEHLFEKKIHQRSFWNHKLSYLVLWWKISKVLEICNLVPGVSNFGRIGPWWDIFERNFILGPWEIRNINFSLWVWSLDKCQFWSLNFTNLSILVPGVLKWKKINSWSLYYWHMAWLVLVSTMEKWQNQPPKFRKLHLWSLCIIINQKDLWYLPKNPNQK
jgi:hypothetical protein